MNKRWIGICGLDGDYEENDEIYFDETHYRLYDDLCPHCNKLLIKI
tara:strand:- start:31 stop:168 length:138 start_codon:yes stop_codon:yes gene_type:complete